jgi:hypothetical protein
MLTPYQIEKMKNFNGFDDVDVDEKRKTKDVDRKRTEEVKKTFSNKCVSSQKHRMRKEEGATVAATPYLLLSWLSRQAGPAAFFHGRIQKH